ncbi:hypothetical protein [Bradyrhizobium sp. HKCCYLR1051]|uniref:hypothetical protein n=1 Tax=Bradyrhizobium sp. HKCCYLR1051 TaxID=3420738 RepID=UPI003EBE39D6
MVRDLVAWASSLDDPGLQTALTSRDRVRRALYARGYQAFDIELLTDEAVVEARRACIRTFAQRVVQDIATLPITVLSHTGELDRALAAVADAMHEPATRLSSPDSTRRSITFRANQMDGRVKPGHDEACAQADGLTPQRSAASQALPELDGFTSAKIEIMAQDLVQAGALGCEQQAILTLSNRGHGHRDIGRLVGRARARARALHAAAPKRISR